MSVISRENLIDFDNFAYGSAQSTLLFLIIALCVVLYIWLGKVDLGGSKHMNAVKTRRLLLRGRADRGHCGLSVLLRDHDQLQDRDRALRGRLLADAVQLAATTSTCSRSGEFPAQHPELGDRRHADGRLRAAARGDGVLRAGAGALPRPDAPAPDHPRGVDVPADRGARGPLRADPLHRHLQHPLGADPQLHHLHPALHRLGADHLHARPADRDRGGGDRRRRDALGDHHQGVPAADVAGDGDDRAAWPSSAPGTSSCSR